MHSFAKAYREVLRLPLLAMIWALMSVFGIVSGAFGSAQFPLWERSLFWTVIVALGVLVGAGLRIFVRDRLGLRGYGLGTLVIAVAVTAVLTPLCRLFAQALTDTPDLVPPWEAMAGYVFVVSVTVSTLRIAITRLPRLSEQMADETGGLPLMGDDSLPRLLERVDPALHGDLLRLQMRNHYVEVVTEAGAERVLMRFADAIAETDGVEGLQVHRSHWVATTALRGIRRSGGKVLLETVDGARVPVSRTYLGVVALMELPELDAPEAAQAPHEMA